MNSVSRPSRSGYRVLIPLGLFLLLAVAWAGGWFYAAARADDVMSAWIEREERQGRTYACAKRAIGGFPFRIEVRCSDLTITLREGDTPVVLRTGRVVAVAQIYQPDLVIAEATGPMMVDVNGGAESYVAEWGLLQASLRGRPRDLRRLSIVVDAPSLVRPATTASASAAAPAPVARAGRLEFHVMRAEGGETGKATYNLAGRVAGAHVDIVPALAGRPFEAEANGVLTGIADFSSRQPLARRLRDWQANGGRLDITGARLQQADALAVASGRIALTSDGRLDGQIDLKLAGADHLTRLILGQDGNARGQASLLAGLTLLSRAELEGRRAIAVPLVLRDGRVYFGPIPVASTSPLF